LIDSDLLAFLPRKAYVIPEILAMADKGSGERIESVFRWAGQPQIPT